VLALLGPNGAGKSTTIEILEGFRMRSAGEVSVLGVDPAHGGEDWRARLGVVLQSWRDHGKWRVRELLAHLGRYYAPYSTPEQPRPWDADELIAAVGLTEHAQKKIKTLSGGQRRRLDVAVGVVGRPRLLFLDEPTTGFDPQARRRFWTLIRGLVADGTTIVLTTHHLEEVEALADRVAVLARGRIAALGDVATFGGRTSGDATVSWMDGGRRHSENSPDPAARVAELHEAFRGPVPGLTVARPSLEDVYLDLIGAHR